MKEARTKGQGIALTGGEDRAETGKLQALTWLSKPGYGPCLGGLLNQRPPVAGWPVACPSERAGTQYLTCF